MLHTTDIGSVTTTQPQIMPYRTWINLHLVDHLPLPCLCGVCVFELVLFLEKILYIYMESKVFF